MAVEDDWDYYGEPEVRLALTRQEFDELLDELRRDPILAVIAPRTLQLLERVNRKLWQEDHDQQAKCAREGCEHPYERHFDSCESMAPVGCKYCPCGRFQEA